MTMSSECILKIWKAIHAPRCYVIVIASNIAYHSIPPISILEHFVNISTPYVMYMTNEIHAMRIGTSRIVRANIPNPSLQ